MKLVAKSDNTTGNHAYSSYVLKSGELKFVFSAPYHTEQAEAGRDREGEPHPAFDADEAHVFFKKHGLAVKAVGESQERASERANRNRTKPDETKRV